MTEVLIFSPEIKPLMADPTRPDGSDSRTESAGQLEEPDAWMEAEENDADDEEEEEDQLVQAFTPNVMILQSTGREHTQIPEIPMQEIPMEKIPMDEQNFTPSAPQHFQPAWIHQIDKPEDSSCVEVMRLCVCVTAAALMFPLLTWAGYKLLPFDAPALDSTPLRLLYTLRCAFFASAPIVLGVLVQGVSRLRFGTLKPLFDGTWENREVKVHGLFVRDSLHLSLLFFLQLAVMATYARPDLLKLVPLLTVVFVFGRMIYWVCVAFGSSVRAFGHALSFLPLLVLLGANLYFIGSVGGPEAVFDVAPPTTAPPPRLRWWG
ncbi:transmembrane protein 79-like [Pimephales promelas]|uniref:transmembrane protein 79-like n=1 Tax=Pimephales promelas TaxID=90988 RepID=UPI001955E67E|nr:transmembrane protein 79-like [Pimephales promelas]XP_039521899.1 transmembrane protein 79-like [Pimephales promelas]XP_039521900.1 transmembrane protein 79-like [Pimephales promelas]KAG1929042.1 transmembrane protein [Pimephales promelas]